MVKWLDIVKKHAKLNPGKSLKEYLPQAKVEWDQLKKSGQVAVTSATKAVKSVKLGGAIDKVSENVANANSSAAAASLATSIMTRSRGRGKTKSRAGGKGKNGRSRTRRVAGRNKSKNRGKTRTRTRTRSRRRSRAGNLDITSINLK